MKGQASKLFIATGIIVIALLAIGTMDYEKQIEKQQEELYIMQLQLEEVKIQQDTIDRLLDLVEDYQTEITRLREILDSIGIDIFEVTAYAPLDPNAVEGMCYEGDPTITASGAKVEVGRTIAADTSILPFGTKVWIEGFGWREVQDRGGAIKGNKIDVAVQTRTEAFEIGRGNRVVLYAN